jgi:hypothetical protein
MARGSHSDEAKLQTAFSDCIVSATRNYARQAFALMRSNNAYDKRKRAAGTRHSGAFEFDR